MNYEQIRNEIRPYTVLPETHLQSLHKLATSVSHLQGDCAELGVYRGGSTLLIAKALPERTIHAFDTFIGITNADSVEDIHQNGDFKDIDNTLDRLTAQPNVMTHVGLFPDTTADLQDQLYCFAHFDGDTYQSAKDFIEYFEPRMVTGGILVFDDYLWSRCPGVEKALNQYFKPEQIIKSSTTQAAIYKTVDFEALKQIGTGANPAYENLMKSIKRERTADAQGNTITQVMTPYGNCTADCFEKYGLNGEHDKCCDECRRKYPTENVK
jgi:predicted O-methyltransferase YrrM